MALLLSNIILSVFIMKIGRGIFKEWLSKINLEIDRIDSTINTTNDSIDKLNGLRSRIKSGIIGEVFVLISNFVRFMIIMSYWT